MPILSVLDDVVLDYSPVHGGHHSPWRQFVEWLHRHSLGVFALSFLLVAGSAVLVGRMYWSGQIVIAENTKKAGVYIPAQPLQGPNMVVATHDLAKTQQKVSTQSFSLTINDKTVAVYPEMIKSWLQTKSDKLTGATYIHVDQTAISKSLTEIASPYINTPVDQIALTHPDGTSRVIAAGRNGTKLSDTSAVSKEIYNHLLTANGMKFILPTETQGFGTAAATSIAKLIEINVVTKQMYLYDYGQLTKSYPISAGAPATPTPIGQFKIYQKFSIQDMRGFNVDGSRYFQPNVRWINYFLPGGYAIHGNYWRPLSWFGAINSSHGCVSLPDSQAKEVYDWAPIGTTVITHY